MTLSAKLFKNINNIIESRYSLSLVSKQLNSYDTLIYSNKGSSVFIKFEKILDLKKKDNYTFNLYANSLSSFFYIDKLEEEQKIFLKITEIFNDLNSFLKQYFKNSNFTYSEFKVLLYDGSLTEINDEFKETVAFWLAINISDSNKLTKIGYVKIIGSELFLDFDKITIEDFELKINQEALSEASKNIVNMAKLKLTDNNLINIRETFKNSYEIKEMIEY